MKVKIKKLTLVHIVLVAYVLMILLDYKLFGIINYSGVFQGYKLNKIQRTYIREKASSVLRQDLKDIVQLSKHVSDNRLHFLDTLANNYNHINYH